MSFPRDAYPYTNFHELNLGYFIVHFREIFSQWADLYDQMLDWKDATTDELAAWKTGVEADLDQREAALRAELETWKAQTGQDIAGWEDATLAALTAWQTATQAVFEAIRVEAAGSASAAAASAGDAATAKTAAETAQAAAEAAAASVQASAAQIATNTGDIADLKTQLTHRVSNEELSGGYKEYNIVFNTGWINNSTGVYDPTDTRHISDGIATDGLMEVINNSSVEIIVQYFTAFVDFTSYTFDHYVSLGSGKKHIIDTTYPYITIESQARSESGLNGIILATTSSVGYLAEHDIDYIKESIKTSAHIFENNSLWGRYTIANGGGTGAIGTTGKRYEASTTRVALNPVVDVHLLDSITIAPDTGYKFGLLLFDKDLKSILVDSGWTETERTFNIGGSIYYAAILLAKTDNSTVDLSVIDKFSITTHNVAGKINEIENSIENIDNAINDILDVTTEMYENTTYWGRYTIGSGGSGDRIGTTGKIYEPSTTRVALRPQVDVHDFQSITIKPSENYKFLAYFINHAVSSITLQSEWTESETTYNIADGDGKYYLILLLAKTDNSIVDLDIRDKFSITTKGIDAKFNDIDGEIAIIEQEINQNLNVIPAYWHEYLEDKMPELSQADMDLGFDGVSFLFITDTHIALNNKCSPQIIKYILDHTNINMAVFGGDAINNYNTKANATQELQWWSENTKESHMINLHGNHDGNSNNQSDASQKISDAEFYGLMCRQSEGFVNWANGKLYGTKDDSVQKVRYIFLDTGAPDSAVIDDAQITWMKGKISELESGWTVVVFCHQFWTPKTYTNPTLDLDDSGTAIMGALDEIYDNINATIACVITGHCHRNYDMVSEKGYPIIATTCDAGGSASSTADPDVRNRNYGTTTEQAMDLFYINTSVKSINVIRIGAGDTTLNRTFSYIPT